MDQNAQKRASAERALSEIEDGCLLGVGTGSTVDVLIDMLVAQNKIGIAGAVSSSDRTTAKLKQAGVEVLDLNAAGELDLYIDGADECDRQGRLIKGGGAALTREKIVASASRRFLCIIDDSKEVDELGTFPLPVEVIPMARSLVARAIVKLGGHPAWRQAVITDNGHWIIDVHGLKLSDPEAMESAINQIPGVVANGLFAQRRADAIITSGRWREPKPS